MWSNLHDGDFFKEFSAEPNEAASMADVVVWTTVVGAGFSITRHFQHFHAFLFNMKLHHDEEQQFVQRLQFMMDYLPDGALHQSYMFLEKDRHNVTFKYKKVLSDFNVVRNLLTTTNMFPRDILVAPLEQTQARLTTEKAESRSKHFTLWKEWGNKITNPFEEFIDTDNLQGLAIKVKEHFQKWVSGRRMSIRDMVAAPSESTSEMLLQLEVGKGIDIYRLATAKETIKKIEDMYWSRDTFIELIKTQGCIDKRYNIDAILGGGTKLNNITGSARSLCCWLSWVYRGLCVGWLDSFWEHMQLKQYSTQALQHTAHLHLAQAVAQAVLSDTGDGIPYVRFPGSMPFFSGAQVWPGDKSLCRFLQLNLEESGNDSDLSKRVKEHLRACARTFMGMHDY